MLLAILILSSMPPGRALPDTGAALFRAWCSSCHGSDGRGVSKTMTRLEVPAADLADCRTSSAEAVETWVGIVRDGGSAYGLSIDMPAYGDGATREQIESVVRYARGLCKETGWPPGELNFPRAFRSEKAFPENELVLVNYDRRQSLIYERRVGKRLQLEAEARTNLDGGDVFDGVTAALKYNFFHRVESGLIASAGLEVTPPVGRQTELELEPYLAFGLSPGTGIAIQGEALAVVEDGFRGIELSAGIAREMGTRFVPMIEGGWSMPRGGGGSFSLYPQLWTRLSRLGHVAASLGVEVPVTGPAGSSPRLFAFVLWDFGDGALNRGW